MNLGSDTVILVHQVPTGQRDDYGRPTYTPDFIVIDRCTFAPTRAQTDENRGVPSMNGATLIAQPQFADLIAAADHIIAPPTMQLGGAWTGPKWELVGEVGRWRESVEVYLRRRT